MAFSAAIIGIIGIIGIVLLDDLLVLRKDLKFCR